MYRPQFAFPPAPAGYAWQPCIYQFDMTNVEALGSISLTKGQESGHIPLPLDHDSIFILMGAKVQHGLLDILLFDPWSNQLMDDYVNPALYASDVQPFTILEGPGIEVPPGAVFALRLRGQ